MAHIGGRQPKRGFGACGHKGELADADPTEHEAGGSREWWKAAGRPDLRGLRDCGQATNTRNPIPAFGQHAEERSARRYSGWSTPYFTNKGQPQRAVGLICGHFNSRSRTAAKACPEHSSYQHSRSLGLRYDARREDDGGNCQAGVSGSWASRRTGYGRFWRLFVDDQRLPFAGRIFISSCGRRMDGHTAQRHQAGRLPFSVTANVRHQTLLRKLPRGPVLRGVLRHCACCAGPNWMPFWHKGDSSPSRVWWG